MKNTSPIIFVLGLSLLLLTNCENKPKVIRNAIIDLEEISEIVMAGDSLVAIKLL